MSDSKDTDLPARLLHELARESLVERRRARRWSIFFRTVTLLLIGGIALAMFNARQMISPHKQPDTSNDGHTALIKIEGAILENSPSNIEPVLEALQSAYDDNKTRGVVIYINSPGGSPVQSGLIYDAIVAQRAEYSEVPVHAVLGDVAASGAYYIAAAAENIYANRASIVGSIGVRLDSFGAVDAIERLGIERRLLIAGEHKGLLDPFEPVNAIALERLQTMLDNVHSQFINAVIAGRGDRLSSDPALFSGLIWSGEEAIGNGLIDALGSTSMVARDVIGAEQIVDFTVPRDRLSRIRRELGVVLDELIGNTLRSVLTM